MDSQQKPTSLSNKNYSQYFKKLLLRIETEGISSHSCEAIITQTPKPDKYIIVKQIKIQTDISDEHRHKILNKIFIN